MPVAPEAAGALPPWAAWLPWTVAPLVAAAAWRVRSLSAGGAATATLVGSIAMAAASAWAVYLVVWFLAAALLSRAGRAAKAARTAGIVAKGDRRDVRQVLANGGVFAALLLAGGVAAVPPRWLAVAAAAALAAAAADTWATEVGTRVRSSAWSLRTRSRVPAGTSGAITAAGSGAMVAGAVAHAALAAALGVVTSPAAVVAVAAGGLLGATADSVIGAWGQARRRCPACGTVTEQTVHVCGTATIEAGGRPWLDNDVVNLLCTLVGAAGGAGTFALLRTYLSA